MNRIAVLNPEELESLVCNAVARYFKENPIPQPNVNLADEVGGLGLARKITGYKNGTIYQLVSRQQFPHFKKRGKLRFRRSELEEWLNSGKVKTLDEMESALDAYQIVPSDKPKRIIE